MSRPQYYTQDTHDSVAAHDDPMENVEVWQDTTAERGYNTYLVQQSSVMDSSHSNESNLQSGGARPTFGDRQTMADRGTIAAARPDIRIGKVEDGDRPTKTSGRKRVWPGWLLLFLMVAGSLFGITWFSIKLYKAAQKQQEKAEFILNRTPRPITPAK
ncbi:hypothetical protein B5M09_007755, partial [Aphanomyces astaci]